jgi:hypothetical protein
MVFLPLQKMWERFDLSSRDSDAVAFFDLMCLGELLVKSTVLGLVAAVDSDNDRHQYRLLHHLVRADGVGDSAHTSGFGDFRSEIALCRRTLRAHPGVRRAAGN